ncbi:MAG: hypothetical protein ACREDL_11530 [Bradyrhizobium sp.]
MAEPVRPPRRRFKQEIPLKVRLEEAARASREAAETASPDERESRLRAARHYEVTANLDDWLSSPGRGRRSG